MNKHPYNILSLENGAGIILTPCPGTKGSDLEASIEDLKIAGTKLMLTLMFDEERASNNIMLIPDICKKNEITWLQLPIVDDDIPCRIFEKYWQDYRQTILKIINDGSYVTIHCKGGSGRTGLVTAMILYCYGWSIDKAINCVQSACPKALRNKTQLAYLYRFVECSTAYE